MSTPHTHDVPLYFVTGGCRSGKSAFAQRLAEHLGEQRLFIATAYPEDAHMHQRIALHQNARGPAWQTHEMGRGNATALPATLPLAGINFDVILLDCLTLWTSACLEEGATPAQAEHHTTAWVRGLAALPCPVVVVSGEVGLGVTPANSAGRDFRDFAGIANQCVARAANTVVFMVSGIPAVLKGFVPSCFTLV